MTEGLTGPETGGAGTAHIRKLSQSLTLLPVAGILLLCPPLVLIFARDQLLFGVPFIVFAIFAIWAGLILAAFLFSRSLSRRSARAD